MSSRLAVMVFALVVVTVGIGWNLSRLESFPPKMPPLDFVEYWAAANLLARGENPYDPARMEIWERRAGREDDVLMMWNPPWVLPLVLPLVHTSLDMGRFYWLILHLGAILGSAALLWNVYEGRPGWIGIGMALSLLWFPTFEVLRLGQITPLMLLGAGAFLVLERRRWDFAAGAVSCLLAIKPQLLYLFWLALLVWAVAQNRWRLLLGGAVTGLFLSAVALALRPSIFSDYWVLARQGPTGYASPTLGYLARHFLNSPHFAWQYAPMVPGLAWLVWYGWRRRRDWAWSDAMPWLVGISLLTTMYGAWLFDLVLLLVPVLHLACRLSGPVPARWRIAGLAAHLALGVAGFMQLQYQPGIQYVHFMWFTPFLLGIYGIFLSCSPEKAPVLHGNE
ncbi:MAG: glycosyltransferase family 87 protein [Gemmataceae bacterium]